MQKLTEEQRRDLEECYFSPELFVSRHCRIYDSVTSSWIPFQLWPAQREVLRMIHKERLVIVLKARQIGLTWCCLAYALWQVVFRPIASVSLFSRRDTEALYLLGQDRMRGMYQQLPDWMKIGHEAIVDSGHEWALVNGSAVRAFPTSAGDSYVSTLAIVDEADLSPDLNRLMRSVKPTIDNGGKLVLLSRVDKTQPESEFKNIYRNARAHKNGWACIFLPWYVHPDRDEAWYERQKIDILTRTTALDDLHEQYPATDTEALAPRTLDKRIPAPWIENCYKEMDGIIDPHAPSIPGLTIYRPPEPGRVYVLGIDPAEGNPTSDDSALTVLDVLSGEECAVLAGKFQPSVIAGHADTIGKWYNNAGVMIERNNHGHAVLLWFEQNSRLRVLNGQDEKPGWLSSKLGKAILYNDLADCFKDGNTILHSFPTYMQLASIEGATLRAPEGQHDDRADSYALAEVGRAAMMLNTGAFIQSRIKGRGGEPMIRRSVRRVAA